MSHVLYTDDAVGNGTPPWHVSWSATIGRLHGEFHLTDLTSPFVIVPLRDGQVLVGEDPGLNG